MAQQQTGDLRHARTGIELRPGLDGVPATQSAICDIDGEQGLLTYRGYPMQDLAANSSFLETAYLLIWGELPSRDQLAEFEHAVQMHRRVSFRVRDMMKCLRQRVIFLTCWPIQSLICYFIRMPAKRCFVMRQGDLPISAELLQAMHRCGRILLWPTQTQRRRF